MLDNMVQLFDAVLCYASAFAAFECNPIVHCTLRTWTIVQYVGVCVSAGCKHHTKPKVSWEFHTTHPIRAHSLCGRIEIGITSYSWWSSLASFYAIFSQPNCCSRLWVDVRLSDTYIFLYTWFTTSSPAANCDLRWNRPSANAFISIDWNAFRAHLIVRSVHVWFAVNSIREGLPP